MLRRVSTYRPAHTPCTLFSAEQATNAVDQMHWLPNSTNQNLNKGDSVGHMSASRLTLSCVRNVVY